MDWKALIVPRGNMVLVRRVVRSATSGGILLPESQAGEMAGVDTALYEVLAAGPGAYNTVLGKRMDMDLAAGDLVIATAMATASTRCATEESDLFLIAESDVLSVVRMPLSHFEGKDATPATSGGSKPRLVVSP